MSKKRFLSILSLIMLMTSICGTAEAISVYVTDDVNDGDCRGPGDEITYTIDYDYICYSNCLDINDVNIIDYLPPEVDFNSASDDGVYDSNSHTVRWYIGTLEPNDFGSVTLTVEVKCVEPGSTIINYCELSSGDEVLDSAEDDTPVCGPPTLTKEDDVPDGNCVGPGDDIIYNIYYDANGYGDTDVVITDELPEGVEYIMSEPRGDYNEVSHTVTWDIGTLEPNESGSVTLTVEVNCPEPNSIITNYCIMTSNCIPDLRGHFDYSDVNNGTYTIEADGSGISGKADYFYFVYRQANSSSGVVMARVVSVENTDPQAKAGVMMRQSLDPDSRFAAVVVTPEEGVALWYREHDGDTAKKTVVSDITAPHWVKIQRVAGMGPALIAAYHADDVNGSPGVWEKIGGDMFDPVMSSPMYLGLCLTSSSYGEMCEAKISDVEMKKGSPLVDIADPCDGNDIGISIIDCEDDTPVCGPPTLTKEDDVPDGNCVGPGDDIIYNIYYDANGYGDTDVVITDELPEGVEYIMSEPRGDYNEVSHTVTWDIGTLEPNESGSVTLTVEVNCPEPNSIITNYCEMTGNCIDINDSEATDVCCCPILTKEDDVPDGNCVGPSETITYSIYYAANGYGDTNVVITDEIPDEVNYVSSDPCGFYDPCSHTVTWDIGTLGPNDSNFITLTVEVDCPEPGGTITNFCEMTGNCIDINDSEATDVCCWCPIYVDADATGCNNGYSWEDAYNYLQDALDAARDCDCNEIRVAEGTYNPDEGTGVEPNDREATFELINGVVIKGGYAGYDANDPDVRDIRQYETILSGDLLDNDREVSDPCDLLNDPCRAENSYHVVTGSGTDETTVLDGFTITAGNANGSEPCDCGGGMYIVDSSTTVTNCTFSGNSADYSGGGMYNDGADPNLTNCTFSGNVADANGGGMCGGSPTITNCTFVGNVADANSGGIYSYNAMVTNCILWGNEDGQIDGNAIVTYSDIQGWEGDGNNIGEDPMFESDGYHLTLCSPCIDTGDPNGDYDGQVDIDGEDRIMDGNGDDTSIVDMGADEYYPDCNLLLYAHCPQPADGATDVPVDVVLSWRPGIDVAGVNGHRVYLDPNEQKVIDRSGCEVNGVNTTDPCYPLPTPLMLGETYHWAIDEVNDIGPDPCLWEGDVWRFTTERYIVVEDFESYANTDALRDVWSDYYTQSPYTSAEVYIENTIVHWGSKSMRYRYRNNLTPYYSESYADITDLPSGIGSDWTTVGGIKALVLWFHGKSDNPVDEQMYVVLEDGAGHTGIVEYDDMNDVTEEDWHEHEWAINLADFTDVNLANVSRITIGFGDGVKGSDGTVYFDDIRLYIICIFSERSEEFARRDYAPPGAPAGDCRIDYRELDIMARDWLMAPPPDPNVDLYGDDTIDFKDFAILADYWLVEQELWP